MNEIYYSSDDDSFSEYSTPQIFSQLVEIQNSPIDKTLSSSTDGFFEELSENGNYITGAIKLR